MNCIQELLRNTQLLSIAFTFFVISIFSLFPGFIVVVLMLMTVYAAEILAAVVDEKDYTLEVVLPKRSSVWVANDKERSIVFNYAGDDEVDSWSINIVRGDGTVIREWLHEILIHSSKRVTQSSPSSSSLFFTFEKSVIIAREFQSDKYLVEICGNFLGPSRYGRRICNKSEQFLVEGVFKSIGVKNKEKHEERFEAQQRASEIYLSNVDLEEMWPVNNTRCTVHRIDRPSKERFMIECMEPGIPCIITGVMDEWKAMQAWTFEQFQNDPRIKEGVYVGQHEEMIPLKVYYDYVKNHAHRSKAKWMVFMPDVFDLYPDLLQDYTVPDFFSEEDDFMTEVDEDLRLDWRWIIMAPKKSGSGWHVDPANTTGWLALVTGTKLWGLYPPTQYHIPGVKNNHYQKRDYEMDDAFNWWVYTRPHLSTKLPLECVQTPGEMVFIPSGWWHSVVNLGDTVAVTQNFCNRYSFKSCLKELREQADSDGLFIGKTFEQLRYLYSKKHPQYFDKDDLTFQAPEAGIGNTAKELKEKRTEELKSILSGKY